jgi:PTH2 family peptidyl-tRNA hydrolase
MKDKDVKQVIVFRKDLQVRKGKIAAQVAHAAVKFLADAIDEQTSTVVRKFTTAEKIWLGGAFAKVVVYCENEQELHELIAEGRHQGIQVNPIVDAGRTEFHGVPTLTCAAFGPDFTDKLDRVTGRLKLL